MGLVRWARGLVDRIATYWRSAGLFCRRFAAGEVRVGGRAALGACALVAVVFAQLGANEGERLAEERAAAERRELVNRLERDFQWDMAVVLDDQEMWFA